LAPIAAHMVRNEENQRRRKSDKDRNAA